MPARIERRSGDADDDRRRVREPRFFIDAHREDGAHRAVDSAASSDPSLTDSRATILAGLSDPAGMRVEPKHLYDALGSVLFGAICLVDEYYPTRTEAAILEKALPALADRIAPAATLIDLGAADCAKGMRLLEHLDVRQYVGVDVAAACLRNGVGAVQAANPDLDVIGLVADFTRGLTLPQEVSDRGRLFFYPGSSIGNFSPQRAAALLGQWRQLADRDARLLIGIDLVKDPATLKAAYDDAVGVTAAFNLNVLRHLNRICGTDFDLRQWCHRAFYDERHQRIEMHLVARENLRIEWRGGGRDVAAGQSIHTENSYKFRLDGFSRLLDEAGWWPSATWTDDQRWFALVLAEPA